MLTALSKALDEHWSHQDELAAINAELTDALVRVTVQANSDPKKSRPTMRPFEYPRPYTPKVEQQRGLDRHKVRQALLGRR